MSAAARLHADEAGPELSREAQQLRAAQAPPQHELAAAVEADQVENGFANVDANRSDGHFLAGC